MKKIPVLEVFGPTIQGEGMVAGQKTMFVRTAGCDYRCSWCDSAFTWDGSQKPRMLTAEDVAEELDELAPNNYGHITISGGNPALHAGIGGLVALMAERGVGTAVETQGSVWQDWMLEVDEVTVSPKPPSSNMTTDWEQLDHYMNALGARETKRHSLKVVIFNETDLAYAKTVHFRYPNVPFYLQVGNDDLSTADDLKLRDRLLASYEWLVEQAASDPDWNQARVLPQIHALLWGNKQGV
ncbi:preQ(0) biosynthesis protein QueE [Salsuginibacillus halophilus]|uniref:7-carboxy-7-deazaguanine synthase n=1 Tax=Salsuginibacillus halophilus TaxID=517424 RepID=A0A2P8HLC6_9BACI|nr:7-carboxy-7-deazaguanine synthase QueE [Salsuginibacillus halophilus]PSL47016.1 preQ(0) biosynthesis protein QueE [Salsuginibacillus halophilus]